MMKTKAIAFCALTAVMLLSGAAQADVIFSENWDNGSFQYNGWTAQGNWGVQNRTARYSWNPTRSYYSHNLTSTILDASGYEDVTLDFDLFLDNWSRSTLEQLTVKVHNGSAWQQVANYTNEGGDIPWTHVTLDISEYASDNLRVRFTAHGQNSYNINAWRIDNIVLSGTLAEVIPGEPVPAPGAAVLGLLGLGAAGGRLRRRRK
ncbi:hypothetical protein [Anaerobaca lacustris]|uniref:PEP-CTERM sorting domain-containing protein n=1 Tax=Anaerobaca lacustris TaxID=3044600 RepID=A0AAW6TWP6_9BACT|nr:hypothetical protein [Sedimentisphaerales bacterium M17dextr]